MVIKWISILLKVSEILRFPLHHDRAEELRDICENGNFVSKTFLSSFPPLSRRRTTTNIFLFLVNASKFDEFCKIYFNFFITPKMFIYQTSADVCRLLPYNRFFNFFKKGKRKERPNVLHYENSKPPSYHNCGAANIEKEKKKKKERETREEKIRNSQPRLNLPRNWRISTLGSFELAYTFQTTPKIANWSELISRWTAPTLKKKRGGTFHINKFSNIVWQPWKNRKH